MADIPRFKQGLLTAVLIGCFSNPAIAFEASDLPLLRENIQGGCPKIWESITSRLIYINGQDTPAEAGVPYEFGMDIWHGSRVDKVRYIAYAYAYLAKYNEDLVLDHASTDGAVITACSNARIDYLETQIQEHHTDPQTEQAILDQVRDDDNDGLFNAVDSCRSTTNAGVTEGTGLYSFESNYEVDHTGCAAWERDEDEDGITDHYDFCFGTLTNVAVVSDGCEDADRDGESNRIDPYPYQNDFECVP